MDDKNLLFIISQPRSGSTLLQALLSNHQEIQTTSEHWLLLPFLSVFKPQLIEAKYDYNLSIDALNDYLSKFGAEEKFKGNLKEFLLKQYQYIKNTPSEYILDKTPRYYEIFDIIYSLFPKAKFIILKRHPVAVFLSIMETWERTSFAELARSHTRDLFEAPKLIQQYTEQFKYPNVRSLRYENLLTNPEQEMESIFAWLGLEYDKNLLNYSGNNSFQGKYGDPKGVIQNQKIVTSNGEDWKKKIKSHPRQDLLLGYGHYLGEDFLNMYGYDFSLPYAESYRFKAFRYYCHRYKTIDNLTRKDLIVKWILEKGLKKS